MTKTKRKTTKLFAFMLFALLLCAITSAFPFDSMGNLSSRVAAFDDEIGFERYIPTLADDFADDCVIVTLKSQYSDVNKSQSFRIPENIPIESIEDLTYITNPAVITDREAFSQIFSITLRDRSKENVLRAIVELERLDHVLAAEPFYNFVAVDEWTPNDPLYNQQWGLRGVNGIQAELAWDITRGETNPRLIVGIFEDSMQTDYDATLS